MTSWFRSWHGAPMDHKWLVVARRAETTPGVVSAIVWALFDYASQTQERGSIEGFDAETYAAYSGFPQEIVEAVLCALAEKGVIEAGGHLTNWEKRQSSRDDDSNERVRRFRANRASQVVTHGVTHGNAVKPTVTQSNAPDIDIDTETETTNSSDDELPVMPPAAATQTALEPATAQPQPKTPRLVTNPTAHQAIFGALAEVCMLDSKLKAAQLGKTAKQLAAAGYDAAQVAAFGEWFRCVDWRGQRGSPPTLAQVVEMIKQSTTPRVQHPVPQERTNGNGRHYDQRERSSGLPKPPVSAADQAYIDSLPAEWRQ